MQLEVLFHNELAEQLLSKEGIAHNKIRVGKKIEAIEICPLLTRMGAIRQ